MLEDIKKALIDERDKVLRHQDIYCDLSERSINRWTQLNDYKNGLKFALDLIEKEGSIDE